MAGADGMAPAPDTTEPNQDITKKPSQFERLRQKRKAIADRKEVDLPIPGYNNELVATYKMLPWEQIRAIIRRMEKSKGVGDRRELYAQADTLVEACTQIRYRDPSRPVDDQLIPLIEGETVRYDEKLAEVLDFPYARPRQCLLETFKNDFAISVHHGELIEWMQGAEDETDQEFVGESQGPQT